MKAKKVTKKQQAARDARSGQQQTVSSVRSRCGGDVVDVEDLETFPSSLSAGRLPLVLFSRDIDEQLVWSNGRVEEGCVKVPEQEPNVRVSDPVVMSNAYAGFVIEPEEPRYLHYNGVGMVFARPAGGKFMQPSIDTLLVCRAFWLLLAESAGGVGGAPPSALIKPRCVLDVGSGSGLLGKFIAAHAAGEEQLSVTLVDVDPIALSFCRGEGFNAFEHNRHGRPVSWKYEAGDAVKLLDNDCTFDFIVSNPPYVPTRDEVRKGVVSKDVSGFWEGVGLVVYLLDLVSSERLSRDAHLVIMVTSLTLKSPAVRSALEAAFKKGVRVQILAEREIAWKAWYAGPSSLDHLLADGAEKDERQQVGECHYFVGATRPCQSRQRTPAKDMLSMYHWHVAYVLHVCSAPDSSRLFQL